MADIEQSRFEREEKRLEKEDSARKKEKQQIAEQRELVHQRMAEQHYYFARLLEEVRRPQERTPPPLHTPLLTVQKFNEGSDDMAAYLDTFEATAVVSEWPRPHWSIHLRGSLSGAGLLAVSALPADQQADYLTVKRVLLSVYQISTETHRKKVFDQMFNQSNPDQWLREYRQNFHQWLDSTKRPTREVVLMELVLAKLPGWLETQMRNQNYQNYEELTEVIIRYQGNQKIRTEKNIKKEKENDLFAKSPGRFEKTEPKKIYLPRSRDGPPPYSRDVRTVECFRCGKKWHFQRDCHVKVENAKCSLLKVPRETQMPEWTKTVKINGKVVKALLDTGCTKTIVHLRCVTEEDYLGWSIPYNIASKRKTHFPAASVTLEVEGKTTTIAVGVSKHITEDMLMGRDIPHFRHYLKKALDVEPGNDEPGNDELGNNELDSPPTTVTIESGMVVTRAQQLQQDNLEEEECLQQERDGPIVSALYPVAEESEAEELEYDKANKIVPPTDERDGEAESDEVLDGVITREELSKSQRNDDTLKHIRDKAGINKEPYFWHKGVLMRKPYNTLGKD